MRRVYWFLVILLMAGVVLFSAGQYYMSKGESQLGYELLIPGIVLLLILLAIGILYLTRVRVKILRNASHF